MAAAEAQVYAKVNSKLKGRSGAAPLLDALLERGFPVHSA